MIMEKEIICECCGERPASQESLDHGYNFCEICQQDDGCSECERPNACSDNIHPIWESAICERCQKTKDLYSWIEKTEEAVTGAAKSAGFEIHRTSSGVSEAVYLVLCKETDDDESSLKIRIADHESGLSSDHSHDEPDYSIERDESETAYFLESVLSAIRRK